MIPITHGLGGMKTRDADAASRILATKGTTAMRRPRSYASQMSSFMSRSRRRSGLFRASVISPSHAPRFLRRERSELDERILPLEMSTRAFESVAWRIALLSGFIARHSTIVA